MTMPNSGTLYLCDPNQTSSCRSIAHSVYGANPPSNVSLCDAGQEIGCPTPIKHSCFYGYGGANTISIVQYYSIGADGTSDVCRRFCLCFEPEITSGSVSVDVSVLMYNDSSTSSSGTNYSCYRVRYNSFASNSRVNTNRIFNCSFTDSYSITPSFRPTYPQICIRACTSRGTALSTRACTDVIITSISNDSSGNNYVIGVPSCGVARAQDSL